MPFLPDDGLRRDRAWRVGVTWYAWYPAVFSVLRCASRQRLLEPPAHGRPKVLTTRADDLRIRLLQSRPKENGMSESLFEKLGGAAAVDAAVDIFYRKVLSDDGINHFFDDTDIQAQHEKQKAFLTMAFGGPNGYTGKDLRSAHAPLVQRGLDESHFNAVAGHLKSTLDELSVPADLVDEVMSIAAGTRDDVLNL